MGATTKFWRNAEVIAVQNAKAANKAGKGSEAQELLELRDFIVERGNATLGLQRAFTDPTTIICEDIFGEKK